MVKANRRELTWIGSSQDDLKSFPREVQRELGFGLLLAQEGSKSPHAVPMAGFGSAGVLELHASFRTDTYRAVYTIRYTEVVYVLHCFQKKSKRGIKTPQADLDLIRARLKRVEQERADDERERRRSENDQVEGTKR